MPSQDPINLYLVSIYGTKAVHGAKPVQQLKMFLKSFDLPVPHPLTKAKAKGMLSKFRRRFDNNVKSRHQIKKAIASLMADETLPVDYDERTIFKARQKDFYQSNAWRELRYLALEETDGSCMACGTKERQLHVDHIYPRSIYPHLALSIENLQVLCDECNLGKGNSHVHDFRQSRLIVAELCAGNKAKPRD